MASGLKDNNPPAATAVRQRIICGAILESDNAFAVFLTVPGTSFDGCNGCMCGCSSLTNSLGSKSRLGEDL